MANVRPASPRPSLRGGTGISATASAARATSPPSNPRSALPAVTYIHAREQPPPNACHNSAPPLVRLAAVSSLAEPPTSTAAVPHACAHPVGGATHFHCGCSTCMHASRRRRHVWSNVLLARPASISIKIHVRSHACTSDSMHVHMRVHSMRLHIHTCALGTDSVAGACLACRPERAELSLPNCACRPALSTSVLPTLPVLWRQTPACRLTWRRAPVVSIRT